MGRRTISISLENTTIKESRAPKRKQNPLTSEVQSIKLFLKTWSKFMGLGLSWRFQLIMLDRHTDMMYKQESYQVEQFSLMLRVK